LLACTCLSIDKRLNLFANDLLRTKSCPRRRESELRRNQLQKTIEIAALESLATAQITNLPRVIFPFSAYYAYSPTPSVFARVSRICLFSETLPVHASPNSLSLSLSLVLSRSLARPQNFPTLGSVNLGLMPFPVELVVEGQVAVQAKGLRWLECIRRV
jgi:hypothetical protein